MRISDWSSDVCSSDLFLALRERKLHLCPAPAVEINRQRHQRHALPRNGPMQFCDFALVQQQFPGAFGFMIIAVAMTELGDIAVDQPDLIPFHLGIAFRDRAFPEAQRSEEHTSELQSLMRISYAVFF